MYQIKFKQLLLTALCAVSATAYADVTVTPSAWVGEPMTFGYTYYLMDATSITAATQQTYKAFISHTQDGTTYYPSYSVYSGADLFYAINGESDYVQLKNLPISIGRDKPLYLYGNGTGKQAYSETTRDFVKQFSGNSDFKFNIYYNWGTISYSLDASSTSGDVTFITFTIWKNTKKWKFISPEQYYGRPKLDEIVSTVAAKWTSADMPEDVKTAYDAAVAAQTEAPGVGQMGVLGTSIKSCYQKLTTAYNKAVYGSIVDENNKTVGSDYVSAYDQLESLIASTEATIVNLKKSGMSYTDLEKKLVDAETALKTYSSPSADASSVSNATSEITSAKNTLSASVAAYLNPSFQYCKGMKDLSESLGYTFPTKQKDALLSAVTSGNSTDKITETVTPIITEAQDSFKLWVSNRFDDNGEGYGFPINSNFSAYILNNDFSMGTEEFWSDNSSETNNVSSSQYVASGEETLYQDITSLPTGTYSLSASVTGGTLSAYYVETKTVNEEEITVETEITNLSQITVAEGQTIRIKVSGTNFTADNFNLTLVGGSASVYKVMESAGLQSNALKGPFSNLKADRVIKYSDKGQWNSLCLPFSLSSGKVSEYFSVVKKVSSITYSNNTITIHYETVTEMEAGESYLVKVNGDKYTTNISQLSSDVNGSMVLSPVQQTYEAKDENNNVLAALTMVGNFSCYTDVDKSLYSEDYKTYLLQANNFYLVAKSAEERGTTLAMKAFRAYFMVSDYTASGAPSLRMSFDEEENNETNIETLSSEGVNEVTYDLMGRRVNVNAQGLYLHKGKKFIVK